MKSQTISDKLFKAITKVKSLDIRQGEPTFFIVELKNPFKENEIFKVVIKDEKSPTHSDEVRLILDLDELKYWTA